MTAALNVLSGVLGDSPSGRLYKALVDNKKAVGASMGMADLHDPGFIIVSAELKQDQSLDEARQIMLKTVEGAVNEPPTKEEVERVKTRMLKNIELEMNDSQAVALDLSEYASQGDWRLMFLMRDRIQTVTPADVLRVAKALSEGIQPHARHLHPHQELRPRGNSGDTRSSLRRSRISRVPPWSPPARRSIPRPANIEVARHAQHPAGRHENGPCCSKKTRGGTVVAYRHPALRRREVAVRQVGHRRNRRRPADARHQEQVAPADPGRDRPAEGADERVRRAHQRQRQHRDHRGQPPRRAPPGGGDPARTGLPR